MLILYIFGAVDGRQACSSDILKLDLALYLFPSHGEIRDSILMKDRCRTKGIGCCSFILTSDRGVDRWDKVICIFTAAC
jgi:hypothetical protein